MLNLNADPVKHRTQVRRQSGHFRATALAAYGEGLPVDVGMELLAEDGGTFGAGS